MSKNLLLAAIVLIALAACKGKKKMIATPTGEVEILSPKKAMRAIANKPEPPQWVSIVAAVNVSQNGSSQGGNADIRISQDSIVWVELSDNIIGLKVIRAFAMQDTVAFYNRIDRTYFAGSYGKVEQKLGTSVPFPFIFNVFQGEPFLTDGELEVLNNHYILSSALKDDSYMAVIDPVFLDVLHQEFITAKDILKIDYSNYELIDGFRFPRKINIEVLGKENLKADFEVKEITTGGPLKLPFGISKKYKRIE